MKKLILSMAVVAMLFSCSKDNVETETTADLTQMTPSKSLDQSSDGMYKGIFGHHSNRDLHGKIFINANNNGNYSAMIEMVNGETIKFEGSSTKKSNIHFTSNRGSFDFNAVNFSAPEVSNVLIDNEDTEAYMVVKKQTTRGTIYILLGTYEDDANPVFNGNWDMISDGVETGLFGATPSQFIQSVTVSHTGVPTPFTETAFELSDPANGCTATVDLPLLFDSSMDGIGDSVLMGTQTSTFGQATTWHINYFGGTYYSADCFSNPASGTWSRGSRSGSIYMAGAPAPLGDMDMDMTPMEMLNSRK
jgi:hypothetical protein